MLPLLGAMHFLNTLEQRWFTLGVATANALGWGIVLVLYLRRRRLGRDIEQSARVMGIDPRFKSLENLLDSLLYEIGRKDKSLTFELCERRIESKEELSHTLEKVAATAYKLIDAESAELALYDTDTGLYHSSFVLGRPFRVSAQAMLSGASEGGRIEASPDVLIQPIAFSGSVMGSLRVGLKKGRFPTSCDQDIMRILALQGSLALVNAHYNEELVKMNRASAESVRAKTGFLANLSHEIRGPLGIMLNAVEIVADGLCGPLNRDQANTLGMVHKNGAHLLDLINDVLDYAKVESGRMKPQPVPIVVDDMLRELGNVVRAQADRKSHALSVRQTGERIIIEVDKRHIRQMMINLLTNAIKYTPDGGKIELWAERLPGNKIKLNVLDTGVGIESDQRDKVFEAFERIGHAYSANQVGTGLGMSLTRRLAEVNSGSIDFSSTPGAGSHFWLVFPAAEDAVELRAEDESKVEEIHGNGECLLLVEEDEGERMMVTRYLSHRGFRVLTAGSKLEALDVVRGEAVSVAVITNAILDGPDLSVIDEIRDNAATHSIPMVLLTTRAFVFDIERYLKAGIDRCLIKPVRLNELGSVCQELIESEALLYPERGGSGEAEKSGAEPNRRTTDLLGPVSPSDKLTH